MEEKEQIFKRIQEYKVDFAFTRKQYYNAYLRLAKCNNRKERNRRRLTVFSIVNSVVTLSGLLYYFTAGNDLYALYLSTIFSVISISLGIYLHGLPRIEHALPYLKRAEEFTLLHKRAKNMIAIIGSTLEVDDSALKEYLLELELASKQKHIDSMPLFVEPEDYAAAKKQIEAGELIYTDSDFQNT